MSSFLTLGQLKMDLLETSHMLLLVKGAYGYAAPEYIITGITLLETLPKEFT